MSFIKNFIGFLFLCCCMMACHQRQENPTAKAAIIIPPAPEKKIQIIDKGTIEFGKSFSHLMNPYNKTKKERDKESDRIEKSNPALQSDPFSKNPAIDVLLPLLTETGIVKDEEFMYKKFKGNQDTVFSYTDSSGKELKIAFISLKDHQPNATYNRILISSGNETDTIETTVYFYPQWVIKDVIPGGNKEIVLLTENYVANNYSYSITVYEIKSLPVRSLLPMQE